MWLEQDISYLVSQIFRNWGGKVSDDIKQYLSSKEVEVVTIMMSLFDDEQIMRTYEKDLKRETLMENAKHMLKMGKLTVEEIPVCYPNLTMDDAKELEAEVMQLA